MFKNKKLLGIILSIILLVFSANGFTAYYKYTQESGANFYVGTADKADALEDTNEMRQIIDDLGALLVHSKRDDLYPKNGTTGGTIQIPEAGLKFSNDPVNNDIAAYIAGEMMWQTKAELGIDLSLYYLKTEINTLSKVETIYVVDIIDSDELAALKFTDLADTPANYTGSSLKFVRINAGETALEFAEEADPTVDTDAEIKAILVDEVIKTGDFTAGRIAKINNATGIIEQGTNTDADVADAVTKKHAAGADTTLGTMTADVNMGTHKLTGLSVPSASGQSVRTTATITEANLEDAISKKHAQNTDTTLIFTNALGSDHTYSGEIDSQPVGESVVFGDLLYFNWTDKEWKKTDADTAATMPGLRIALETKADGETCLMLVKGYCRDDNWNFTGAMIYTSVTPGAMSSTAPTETGDQVQRVGVAKSADVLFFDPSIDVGEI